ncbi:MAG: hypothetical protein KJ901_18995 [Gammaproteobacteria bacterium]|nr:hypothetical protein [Gammaproteobacteria bacterium]MBU1440458.1 hypothetical protein [Gammaproteobacteria bacterium]
MSITLCTLFEGHYHFGVAGLANSLAAAGYEGTLWIGHRGPLPDWIRTHPRFDGETTLQVTPALKLCTIALDPPVSLNYCKADLIREILEEREPDAEACAYVDPDIVVTCPWPQMAEWFTADGLALVEESDGDLPADAPKRRQWADYFAPRGLVPLEARHRYFNSGFVAVPRSQLAFVKTWARVCGIVAAECGRAPRQRKAGVPGSLFHSTDEDALNFALMLCAVRVDAHGPEAMGFAPNGRHLSHAVGAHKPWQGRHLRRALRGTPPFAANTWYFRFVGGPLTPFARHVVLRRRASLALAGLIGRMGVIGRAGRVG